MYQHGGEYNIIMSYSFFLLQNNTLVDFGLIISLENDLSSFDITSTSSHHEAWLNQFLFTEFQGSN